MCQFESKNSQCSNLAILLLKCNKRKKRKIVELTQFKPVCQSHLNKHKDHKQDEIRHLFKF